MLAVGAVLLPLFARSSNCGGNSAAQAACRTIFIYNELAVDTNAGNFDLAQLDAVDRTNLFETATSHWTPNAGYWLRTNRPREVASKYVVVVCDIAYSNVPQPTVWNLYRETPAHAVAYSDGKVGLISPAEFKKLDLGGFISVTAMATNSAR